MAAGGDSLLTFCYDLYQKGQLVDLSIMCEGNTPVSVHSVVMAASSEYIRSFMLQVGGLTGISSSFKCENVSAEVVKVLVEHIYTGVFSGVYGINLRELYDLAKQLQVTKAVKDLDVMMEELHGFTRNEGRWFACGLCYACFEDEDEVTDGLCVKCHTKNNEVGVSSIINVAVGSDPASTESDSGQTITSNLVNLKAAQKPKKIQHVFNFTQNLICKACKKEFQSARLLKRHKCGTSLVRVLLPETSVKELGGVDLTAEDVITAPEMIEGIESNSDENRDTADALQDAQDIGDGLIKMEEDDPEAEVFKCQSCNYTTTKARYLADHTRMQHRNVLQACPYCHKKFARKVIYRHRRRCPQKKKIRAGAKEGENAEVQGEDAEDKDEEENPEEMLEDGEVKCPYCEFISTKARYMADHTRKVHGSQPVPCIFCKQDFPRKDIFKHKKTCPEKPTRGTKRSNTEDLPVLECPRPKCSYSTHLETRLANHLKWTHGEGRPKRDPDAVKKEASGTPEEYMCEKCAVILPNRSALKKHMLAQHSEAREFKCDLCEYTGKTANCYKSHYQHIHNLNPDGSPFERKFACDKCDFRAVHRSMLRLHMRVHSEEKPFQCDQCLYATNRKDSLIKHLQTMHVADRKARVCKICGKSFLSATGFRVHMMSHMNAKPYKCEECNMEFLRQGAYKTHILTRHENVKPLHCDQCQYSCVKGASLRHHMAAKHGITNIRIVQSKAGPVGGTTHMKYRFKEFKNVDTFLANNTIEREVSSLVALKEEEEEKQVQEIEHQVIDELTVASTIDVRDAETQEASEILAGIGANAEISQVTTMQIATEHLYEIDGEQVAVLYI